MQFLECTYPGFREILDSSRWVPERYFFLNFFQIFRGSTHFRPGLQSGERRRIAAFPPPAALAVWFPVAVDGRRTLAYHPCTTRLRPSAMRNRDGRTGIGPAFLPFFAAGGVPRPGSRIRGRCMSESSPPDPVSAPADAGGRCAVLGRLVSLALVLEVALALRVAAADAVEWYVRRGGPARLDLFPDTDIYWELARAIRAGGPYEYVEWGDIPHFAIRTPGYPLFLAACQAVFGERTLPVRLVQAALGTLCVYLVYRLARQSSRRR